MAKQITNVDFINALSLLNDLKAGKIGVKEYNEKTDYLTVALVRDYDAIKQRCGRSLMAWRLAACSYFEDRHAIMTDEAYVKMLYRL